MKNDIRQQTGFKICIDKVEEVALIYKFGEEYKNGF
jgi:hypothetical protein